MSLIHIRVMFSLLGCTLHQILSFVEIFNFYHLIPTMVRFLLTEDLITSSSLMRVKIPHTVSRVFSIAILCLILLIEVYLLKTGSVHTSSTLVYEMKLFTCGSFTLS